VLDRRTLLASALAGALPARAAATPFLAGGALSALTWMERVGAVYRDRDGQPGDCLALLKRYGHNIVRIRLYEQVGPGTGADGWYWPEGSMDLPDVLALARRARTRTLDLRETLQRRLFQARRSGGTVDWAGETLPRIAEALEHIRERQQEEAAILQAVSTQDLDRLADQARADLVALRETVEDCQYQHAGLHHEVMGINDRYLALQGNAFRAHERSALSDIEQDILLPLLHQPRERLTELAPAITAELNPARLPKLFDPLLLVDLIGRQSHLEDEAAPAGETDLQPLEARGERFPPALVGEMANYLRGQVAQRQPLSLSELLTRAEADGLDRDARLCLIYLAIGAYTPKDDYLGLQVEAGGPLDHPLVQGHDLSMELPDAR
jgi:hypothetical protein